MTTASPTAGARCADVRGRRVVAVASVSQSHSAEPAPRSGQRLVEVADPTRHVRAPDANAMVTIGGIESPVGPGSTAGAVSIVNATPSAGDFVPADQSVPHAGA